MCVCVPERECDGASNRMFHEIHTYTACVVSSPGANIFRRGLQALWLVPHPGTVWVLLHVWTGGAPAHTGQTQTVRFVNSNAYGFTVGLLLS